MDRCPSCDEQTFDYDSQSCYNCGIGTADDPASGAILHSMYTKEDVMSEHENEHVESEQVPPAAQEAKVYPGGLDRYKQLRADREAMPKSDPNYIGLCIAEELAGLSYIQDGIRYNSRTPR